jgi:hypothetical protein
MKMIVAAIVVGAVLFGGTATAQQTNETGASNLPPTHRRSTEVDCSRKILAALFNLAEAQPRIPIENSRVVTTVQTPLSVDVRKYRYIVPLRSPEWRCYPEGVGVNPLSGSGAFEQCTRLGASGVPLMAATNFCEPNGAFRAVVMERNIPTGVICYVTE